MSVLFRAILLAAALGGMLPLQAPTVTFTEVAPILDANCVTCHQPGGGAPFSLLTYDDVRRRASLIAEATASGYMPPWKPEAGFGVFEGERRLTESQRQLIRQWVESGTPEGDRQLLAAPPPVPVEWRLGVPDQVVTLPEPYQLRADGADVFRTFVIPMALSAGRYVRGLEFRPGIASAVHHATIKIDPTRSSRRLDEDEPGPGYDGGGARTATFPDGHFLGWTPGQVPYMLPDGMGWRLEPGTDLVLEVHMMPTGKQETIQPSIGLFFTDQVPSRHSFILRLGSQSIDIPAGDREYTVTDSFVLPVDVAALSIQPHAHYLAKAIQGVAEMPDGSKQWLLYIKQWDFKWQGVYRYREPLALPKGTTLSMRFTYDNSADNLHNPNRPPKRVTYGQTTASEMGNLWLQIVARNNGDLDVLERAYAPKLLQGDIAGNEKMLELTPEDPRLHADLAFLYLAAGRRADATVRLEEAVRLHPDSAATRYALGTVLLGDKKLEQAREAFRAAIRLNADFSEAYNNLGVVSDVQGRLDDAIVDYSEALRLQPDNLQARYNLGRARASQGRFVQAIEEYTQVLRLRPGDVDTLNALAGALASTGQIQESVGRYRQVLQLQPDHLAALVDLAWILATSDLTEVHAPDEAVRLAARVAELTRHENATVMETLAVAYYSAQMTNEAAATAEAAISLASKTGATDAVREMRQRLEFYEQRFRRGVRPVRPQNQ
jgi:tetratricopeptide (TPR) repeat protein